MSLIPIISNRIINSILNLVQFQIIDVTITILKCIQLDKNKNILN